MSICRLIFRKDIGQLLLRVVYNDENIIPTLEQEKNTFAVLNGYNEDALVVIDIPETDVEFHNAAYAESIKLENGNLVYTLPPETPPEPSEKPDPISQLNEKVDLLIMMMLEKEGII